MVNMDNRDFDQDDARELAEFAGGEIVGYYDMDPYDDEIVTLVEFPHRSTAVLIDEWKPWSLEAPMWQIQSCLDAVREKGLEDKFEDQLLIELTGTKHPSEGVSITELTSAPPEAICKSVLEIIPEGSGE